MILECHQCSSCYFEDTEPSTRIDSEVIESGQRRLVFQDVVVAFVCVELYDCVEEVHSAAQEFIALSSLIGKRPIVLCPNVHLSMDVAPEKQSLELIQKLEHTLKDGGFEVHRLSFGYHKKYGMDCNGNVGSIVGRRFYGSQEKQFLRLLTRLGVCVPDCLPDDMPVWAKLLTERQLKVLGSRKQTYNIAKQMLHDELNTGEPELWTCMLFEGERYPIQDYISTLYGIIEEYPTVKIHRALNLSVPGFSNEARLLFRKNPDAIKSGKLRIYNSKVADIEFLLTRMAVLLAFPQRPKKAGSYAGAIAFGIYCKDTSFAKNLIRWYETFLVDTRFGRICTEAELDIIINTLEEEVSQDRR
jgi:hypothetical protein